jgi:cytochrome b561
LSYASTSFLWQRIHYACGIGYTAAYVYRILSRLYSCTDGCYYESRRLYSVL